MSRLLTGIGCLAAIAINATESLPSERAKLSGRYEVTLTQATVNDADSALDLVIAIDSSEEETRRFYVEHDSVRVEWQAAGVGPRPTIHMEPRLKVSHELAKPVLLVWDSSSAVDTRLYVLELLPEDFSFTTKMKWPPTKVKPRKPFECGLFSVTRVDNSTVSWSPILFDYFGSVDSSQQAASIRAMAGKRFQYTLAIDRGYRFDRYNFKFVVKSAEAIAVASKK